MGSPVLRRSRVTGRSVVGTETAPGGRLSVTPVPVYGSRIATSGARARCAGAHTTGPWNEGSDRAGADPAVLLPSQYVLRAAAAGAEFRLAGVLPLPPPPPRAPSAGASAPSAPRCRRHFEGVFIWRAPLCQSLRRSVSPRDAQTIAIRRIRRGNQWGPGSRTARLLRRTRRPWQYGRYRSQGSVACAC